jgi:hypothetical protein
MMWPPWGEGVNENGDFHYILHLEEGHNWYQAACWDACYAARPTSASFGKREQIQQKIFQ